MPALDRRPLAWVVLLLLVAAFSGGFALVGLPSAVLFGSLAAGLVYALSVTQPPEVPKLAFTAGQAILGTAIGALFELDSVTSLGWDWLPVLLISLATLALSVAAGFVLRLHRSVSAATGAFAMVAGGASGIVAIARELGADDRIVAVVQYLRVLVILVGMPVVARVFFDSSGSPGQASPSGRPAGTAVDVLVTVLCVVAGLVLARRFAIPAAALLFPLMLAVLVGLTGIFGLTGVAGAVTVPTWLQAIGFALIGLQVGLRFTRESLRVVASLLPLALATILVMVAASALLGVVLAEATGRTPLDGYLATTPGGLYAVLATAIGNGSDVTFVLTVQLVRLFVMLFSAPLLARWLRRTTRDDQGIPPHPG